MLIVIDKLDENAVVGGFNNEAAEKLLVSFHDFIEQLQMLQLTHFLLGRPLVRLVDREVNLSMLLVLYYALAYCCMVEQLYGIFT